MSTSSSDSRAGDHSGARPDSQPSAAADLSTTVLPSRRSGRRRERHGRGLRGPLLPPTAPGAQSRSERFDALMLRSVSALERSMAGHLNGVEFAVEDIPPSAPAPWETGGVPLGRYFPADAGQGLADRIVLYRRPIESRCEDEADVRDVVRHVLVEQVAQMTGQDPDDIDPWDGI